MTKPSARALRAANHIKEHILVLPGVLNEKYFADIIDQEFAVMDGLVEVLEKIANIHEGWVTGDEAREIARTALNKVKEEDS